MRQTDPRSVLADEARRYLDGLPPTRPAATSRDLGGPILLAVLVVGWAVWTGAIILLAAGALR